jgi:hypothetical protein
VNKPTTIKETLPPQAFQETWPTHAFKTQPLPLERTKANAPSNWQTKITAGSKGKHTIQMTNSPTILSTSMAASLISQQTVDTPVPDKQRAVTRVSHQNIHHRFYLDTDADKGSNLGLENQDLLDVVNSIDVLRRGDKGKLFACNMRSLTTQDYGHQYDWTPAQTETQLVDPERHLASKEIALLHQQVLNGIRNGKAFVGHFGGTNGLFGDVGLVRDQIAAASADLTGANLTSLAGTGISMQGIDQNPVFYEAVLDGLWGDADRSSHGLTPSTTQYLQDWGSLQVI